VEPVVGIIYTNRDFDVFAEVTRIDSKFVYYTLKNNVTTLLTLDMFKRIYAIELTPLIKELL
jgi:hypothetical protein